MRPRRRSAGLFLASTCWLVALGCDRPPPPGTAARTTAEPHDELETVDVGEPLDAELSTESDTKARGVGSHVAGVLPEGFPRDLPLPAPATLVDFGGAGAGQSFVEFFSPDSATTLGPRWERQLAAAGWSRSGAAWSRAGRRVRVIVEGSPPGSRVRIEYRPG